MCGVTARGTEYSSSTGGSWEEGKVLRAANLSDVL